MIQPSTVFLDKRNIEIGRSDQSGKFYPATPGLTVSGVPADKYTQLATVDWEYIVHKKGGDLEAAARWVFFSTED